MAESENYFWAITQGFIEKCALPEGERLSVDELPERTRLILPPWEYLQSGNDFRQFFDDPEGVLSVFAFFVTAGKSVDVLGGDGEDLEWLREQILDALNEEAKTHPEDPLSVLLEN